MVTEEAMNRTGEQSKINLGGRNQWVEALIAFIFVGLLISAIGIPNIQERRGLYNRCLSQAKRELSNDIRR